MHARSQLLSMKKLIKKNMHKPVSNKGTLAVHLNVSTTEVLEFFSQPKKGKVWLINHLYDNLLLRRTEN